MPHSVAVNHVATRRFRNGDHASIYVGRNTCDHLLWGRAQTVGWSGLAYHFEVATNAAGRDDNELGTQAKFVRDVAVCFLATQGIVFYQNRTGNTLGSPIFHLDPVGLMAEFECNQTCLFMFQTAAYKVFDDALASTLSQVKPWNRIAVSVRV